jgi:hypothetical protein
MFTQNKEVVIINGSNIFKCNTLTADTYMKSKNGNYTVEFQMDGTIAVYVGKKFLLLLFIKKF